MFLAFKCKELSYNSAVQTIKMEKKLLIVVGLMITLNIFWGFLVSIQLPFFPIEVRN